MISAIKPLEEFVNESDFNLLEDEKDYSRLVVRKNSGNGSASKKSKTTSEKFKEYLESDSYDFLKTFVQTAAASTAFIASARGMIDYAYFILTQKEFLAKNIGEYPSDILQYGIPLASLYAIPLLSTYAWKLSGKLFDKISKADFYKHKKTKLRG